MLLKSLFELKLKGLTTSKHY